MVDLQRLRMTSVIVYMTESIKINQIIIIIIEPQRHDTARHYKSVKHTTKQKRFEEEIENKQRERNMG